MHRREHGGGAIIVDKYGAADAPVEAEPYRGQPLDDGALQWPNVGKKGQRQAAADVVTDAA